MASIIGAVRFAYRLCNAVRGSDPRLLSAVVSGVFAVVKEAVKLGAVMTSDPIFFFSAARSFFQAESVMQTSIRANEQFLLLYRAAAPRIDIDMDLSFIYGLVRWGIQAYPFLKELIPLLLPFVVGLLVQLFHYLQAPATHTERRHHRERGHGAMAERAGDRRRLRDTNHRMTVLRTNHPRRHYS